MIVAAYLRKARIFKQFFFRSTAVIVNIFLAIRISSGHPPQNTLCPYMRKDPAQAE